MPIPHENPNRNDKGEWTHSLLTPNANQIEMANLEKEFDVEFAWIYLEDQGEKPLRKRWKKGENVLPFWAPNHGEGHLVSIHIDKDCGPVAIYAVDSI
jgi:hypothetical protein